MRIIVVGGFNELGGGGPFPSIIGGSTEVVSGMEGTDTHFFGASVILSAAVLSGSDMESPFDGGRSTLLFGAV